VSPYFHRGGPPSKKARGKKWERVMVVEGEGVNQTRELEKKHRRLGEVRGLWIGSPTKTHEIGEDSRKGKER